MRKRLPKPQNVRFQTSQIGVNFRTLGEAREDFEQWLETGESPAGAKTQVHIWQYGKKRTIPKIDQSDRGEILRAVIRRALRSGKLQIRKSRKSRG